MRTNDSSSDRERKISLPICLPSNRRPWRDDGPLGTRQNTTGEYTLNTRRFITVTGAGHRTYATYEYGILDFSGLRKRSQYESAFHKSDRLPLLWPYC